MASRLNLPGHVALVTGAGAGIGLAVARELHRRGTTVVLVDVDAAAVAAAAATFEDDRVDAVVADVRDRDAIAGVVHAIAARHGGLDVVVANAGVAPQPSTVRRGDPADFDRVLGVNLVGAYNTVRPALDALATAGGHAVIVASVAAFTPTPGGAAYAVSKAGAEALGRCLRIEMAPYGVSVGVAYFGVVETEMTHETLDRNPLGPSIESLLPSFLRRRITAADAASALVAGIEARAARTVVPRRWTPYAHLRGIANVAIDAASARDPRLHRIVRALDVGIDDVV